MAQYYMLYGIYMSSSMEPVRTTNEAAARIERALIGIRRTSGRQALRQRSAPDAPATAGALFAVLDALEDSGRTVTELAAAIGVDQPRASRLVQQAVDAGLARRAPHPDDGRRSLVTLTRRGRDVVDAAHRSRQEAVRDALAGFSARDATALARLLERFVDQWLK